MSTPALDRAAGRHELFNRVPFPPACSCGVEMPDGNVRENFAAHLDDVARTARAVVSRALHDPDDPDFGAKVLFRFDYDEEKWGDWSMQFLTVQSVYRERYANLVAAILGEAS